MAEQPEKGELVDYVTKFAESVISAVSDMAGMELTLKGDGTALQEIETELTTAAIMPFSGPVSGDFFIFVREEEWRPALTELGFTDEEFTEGILEVIKEVINVAAASAMMWVQMDHGALITIHAPRILQGSLLLPEMQVARQSLQGVSLSVDVFLALDTMDQSLSNKFKHQTKELAAISNILESIEEILIIVEPDGSISEKTTAPARNAFGEDIIGKDLPFAFRSGGDQAAETGKKMGSYLWTAANQLLPEQFQQLMNGAPATITLPSGDDNEPTEYKVAYTAVIEADKLQRILITLTAENIARLKESIGFAYKKIIESMGDLGSTLEDGHDHQEVLSYLKESIPLAETSLSAVDHLNPDMADEMLRSMHLIKGGSRMLHFDPIEYFAHNAEKILVEYRETRQLGEMQLLDLKRSVRLVRQGLSSLRMLCRARVSEEISPWKGFLSVLHKSTEALAIDLGKRVDVSVASKRALSGLDLSLLRHVLTHMIRNSVDHGIEAPGVRQSRGKPDKGHISINVDYTEKKWIIDYRDDGGGLNRTALLQKARADGMDVKSKAEDLSHDELLQILTRPGLSTRDKASTVSGRGVGLDSVLHEIQSLQGTLELVHTSEQGCHFRFTWSGRNEGYRIKKVEAKFLLVDDDPDILQTMQEDLATEFSVPVRTATSKAEAMRILENETDISLLITDLMMPASSGWMLISEASSRYPDLDMLVITGIGHKDEVKRTEDLGITVIHKPIVRQDLLTRVRNLLQAREQRDSGLPDAS